MHEEALTKHTATLFPSLSRLKGFYLVGGTALALQIGHRLSVDFDMFSSTPLQPNLLRQVKRVFSDSSIQVTYRVPDQLNLLIDNIQTTFFYYEYPVVNPFVEYKGVPLVDVQEVAAMKAFAVGKRLAYKDYVDWYFMLQEGHTSLGEVILLCEKKFGNDFNDRLFLGQLVSMEDIPTQKIDFLRDPVERKTIEIFLREAVKNFKL